MLGGWVNPTREQQTIPQGPTSSPPKSFFTQVLEGHTDEIFSAAFNYDGDTIITGSKDNTCRIWKC